MADGKAVLREVLPGALEVGLVVAHAAFAATVRGPRDRFWPRMTITGINLGLLALLKSRPARRTQIGPTEVAMGLASAATSYATFRVGDVFARRFVPGGDAQIRDIYTLGRSVRGRRSRCGWRPSSARPRSCSGGASSRRR